LPLRVAHQHHTRTKSLTHTASSHTCVCPHALVCTRFCCIFLDSANLQQLKVFAKGRRNVHRQNPRVRHDELTASSSPISSSSSSSCCSCCSQKQKKNNKNNKRIFFVSALLFVVWRCRHTAGRTANYENTQHPQHAHAHTHTHTHTHITTAHVRFCSTENQTRLTSCNLDTQFTHLR
jgi:hypothetical protein